MEFTHDVKVGVMRYLDEVALQLDYLAPPEREVILQGLYARMYHMLAGYRHGHPTLHDLQKVLADLPQPRTYARTEKTETAPLLEQPVAKRGNQAAIIGAGLMPFAILLFARALMLASTATTADKLTPWDWLVMLVGFQAPMIVTMLGIMGIAAVREAKEQRGGMALAVSVTLTFPLLLIDGTLIYLVHAGFRGLWNGTWLVPLAAVLILLALNFQIIRGVWMAAIRPVDAIG